MGENEMLLQAIWCVFEFVPGPFGMVSQGAGLISWVQRTLRIPVATSVFKHAPEHPAPVCVPAVLGGLAVWWHWHNNKTKRTKGSSWARTTGRTDIPRNHTVGPTLGNPVFFGHGFSEIRRLREGMQANLYNFWYTKSLFGCKWSQCFQATALKFK